MPVTPEAAVHLRAAGHDVLHAGSVGLATVSDAQLLDAARRDMRVIITADLDYPRLLALERAEGPGVILFRGGSYSDREMLDLLDRVLATVSPTDLDRSITVVDRGRIRRQPIAASVGGDLEGRGRPLSSRRTSARTSTVRAIRDLRLVCRLSAEVISVTVRSRS